MDVDAEKLAKLISVVSATVDAGGAQPAGFLLQVMAGYDPRDLDSTLYRMVRQIDLEDRLPDEAEWAELKTLVLDTDLYKRGRVSLDRSHMAAKDLMEYLHPKLSRSSVDQTTAMAGQTVGPLIPEDVEVFEDWFFGEF